MNTRTLDLYTQSHCCKIFSLQHFHASQMVKDLHRHSFYQILLLYKGTVRHFIDFELQEAEAPFVSVVFPNQIHRMELSEDAQMDVIMFDASVFCSALLANELKDYNIDLQSRINFVQHIPESEWKHILGMVSQISELSAEMTMIKKMEIKFLIKIILLKIIDMAPKQYFMTSTDSDVQVYLQFREALSRGVEMQKRVQTYADELGVSTKKLTAVCNRYTGRTPLEIIHERLGVELKRAILEDGLLWKELAFRFGFSSQSALNKFIERQYGCTPQKWKESLEKGILGKLG